MKDIKMRLKSLCAGMMVLAEAAIHAAAPTKSATPTWYGVINNHAQFRITGDNGLTTEYEVQVKRDGEADFSHLANIVRTLTGSGGFILDTPFAGTSSAVFRARRANGDGTGAWSNDLPWSETNALPGTAISSGAYSALETFAASNILDGVYTTYFSSKETTSTNLWIGVDFSCVKRVTGIRYIPRYQREDKITNAVVEVAWSSDFSDAVVACVLPSEKPSVKIYSQTFETPVVGRYARLRKQTTDKAVITIGELEFLGEPFEGPTASGNPTWWGVINNHAQFRVVGDGGVTTTYEIQVKRDGESDFSCLTNVVQTLTGTGGYIFFPPFDGTRSAVFRARRANANGEGAWSDQMRHTGTNALSGTVITSGAYNSQPANAASNVVDGSWTSYFSSKQTSTSDLWIGFDFGEEKIVTGMRYIPRNQRGAALTNATVEVARQANFSDAVAVDVLPATAPGVQLYTRTFAVPGIGRYARLRKQLDGQTLTLSELEFLGATPVPAGFCVIFR